MKLVHTIKASVFADENENILDTFLSLFPFSCEKLLHVQHATSVQNNLIIIYTILLTRQSHIRAFWNALMDKLSKKDKQLLSEQKHSRLDNNLAFFLRLGKSQLLKGKYKIVEGGNCVHVRVVLAAYPKHRIKGMRIVDELLTKRL